MSSKVNVAPVVFCDLALAATATGQRIEPIHSDPSDDKMGKALCAADGVAAIGVTAPAARPCAPDDDGGVATMTADWECILWASPGDCSCASVTVPCIKPARRADYSPTGTRDQAQSATSGRAAPIMLENMLQKAADATSVPATPTSPNPVEAQPFASRILSAASLSKVTPFSSSRVSSSPDRVISVMISHPPTNSPFT